MVPREPNKVTLLPLQIVKEGEAVMVGVGVAFTVTVCVAVPEHPAVVPVSV